MRLHSTPFVLTAALTLAAAGAHAQVMTVTDQQRFIEGTTISTMEDGSVNTIGPVRMDAPPGMFMPMPIDVPVPGSMMLHAMQEGGWDGGDFIRLNQFNMSFSGGGGPGTAGTGTLTNAFGYTFTINQPAVYTLDGLFGGSPPIEVRFQFTGPSVSIDDTSLTAPGNTLEYHGVTGTLAPGSYTMLLQGSGTISYVGPGGNGGGAGGGIPILQLQIVAAPPPTCGSADFNCDGDVGTDADIEGFFACLAGTCPPPPCTNSADFNADGDIGTDADIEAFFRVLGGGTC